MAGVKREQILQEAEKLAARGKLDAAIKEYRRALEGTAHDTNTLNRLGDLLVRVNRIVEAIDVYQKIAEHFAADGFFLKAIAIYKKVNRLDPQKTDVYERLADLYFKQGLVVEGRQQLVTLADWFTRSKQLDQAVRIYRRLADLDPTNVQARAKLVDLLSQAGDRKGVTAEIENLGRNLLSRGMLDEAVKLYHRALEIGIDRADFLAPCIDALLKGGRIPQAVELANAGLKAAPADNEVRRAAAHAYSEAGDIKRARDLLDGLSGSAGERTDVVQLYGDLMVRSGESAEAKEKVLPAVDRLLASGDKARAGTLLKRLLRATAGDIDVLERAAKLFTRRDDPEMAANVEAALADAYFRAKRAADAMPLYRHLVQSDPGNALFAERLRMLGGAPAATPAPPIAAATAEEQTAEADVEFIDVDLESLVSDEDLASFPVTQRSAAADDTETAGEENRPRPAGTTAEELYTEAVVFAKYGLVDKAINHLHRLLSFDADHEGGRALLSSLGGAIVEVEPEPPPAVVVAAESPPPVAPAPETWAVEASEDDASWAEAPASEPDAWSAAASQEPEPWDAAPAAVPEPWAAVPAVPASESWEAAPATPAAEAWEAAPEADEFSALEAAPVEHEGAADEAFDEPEPLAAPPPIHAVPAFDEPEPLAAPPPMHAVPAFDVPAPLPAPAAMPPVQAPRAAASSYASRAAGQVRLEDLENMLGLRDQSRPARSDRGPASAPAPPVAAPVAAAVLGPKMLAPEPLEELSASAASSALPTFEVAEAPAFDSLESPAHEVSIEWGGFEAAESAVAAPAAVGPAAVGPEAVEPAADPFAEALPDVAEVELIEMEEAPSGPDAARLAEVDFLVEQGLLDEAAGALDGVRAAFPDHPEVSRRQALLKARGWEEDALAPAGEESSAAELFSEEDQFFDLAAELEKELADDELVAEARGTAEASGEVSIEDLFKEFQRGVAEQVNAEDFDTHFNLGLAYREMGLLDEAIGEFQLAAKSEELFVESASMIGACYVDKGLFEQAAEWFSRALIAPDLPADTAIGLTYELARAQELAGNTTAALMYYTEVLTLNPGFRDVVARVSKLQAN